MSHHQQHQQEYSHDQIILRGLEPRQVGQASSNLGLLPVYQTPPPEMLSEMFNFGHGPSHGPSTEILDYRRSVTGLGSDWYGPTTRQVAPRDTIGDHHNQPHHHHHHHDQMQLFLTNPPQRSPSPPQQPPQSVNSGGAFDSVGAQPRFTTAPSHNYWSSENHAHINNPGQLGGIIEGQGLSLSLSSSLQHLEAAKHAQELRTIGDGDNSHLMLFNILQQQQQQQQQQQPVIHNLPGVGSGQHHQVHVGFGSGSGSSLGMVNGLRNSKYVKAAQELLEEFCSVGRGHLNRLPKLARQGSVNPNPSTSGTGAGSPSTSSKDPPQLSAGERAEHQRRKVKLLSMLDEVDRRYSHYCEQMQMVVNSFDLAMGYGAAIPYTGLAQKAMSRHFRCLKDAIQAQLRLSCEALGEKDPTAQAGLTKGETPRLKLLEQSLRQQRAFQHHQMGLNMEQEAWRPQRGLPERSVNILRSWLFEHFLHPYPSDADKHTLARQTGLSRNQVSNWFINARVRLWKPMVEEMYQQEAKEAQQDEDETLDQDDDQDPDTHQTTNTNNFANATTQQTHIPMQLPPTICSSSSSSYSYSAPAHMIVSPTIRSAGSSTPADRHQPPPPPPQLHGSAPPDNVGLTTMIRFGAATAGDVSLTLGLQHAGNATEKSSSFSVRDFPS